MRNRWQFAGFTLVELMVTLLLAAIVLSYGVPGFRSLILNNRQSTQMNNFLTALMLARSEAVKRHQSITLCKSANSTSCTNAGGWEQGWIVFNDPNNNRIVEPPAEVIIRAYPGFTNGATLRGTVGIRNSLGYQSTGYIATGNNGMFVYCDARVQNFANDAAQARVLIISPTGQARVFAGNDAAVANNGGVNSCLAP